MKNSFLVVLFVDFAQFEAKDYSNTQVQKRPMSVVNQDVICFWNLCVLHCEFAYLSRFKSTEDDACCYAFSTCIAYCFPLVMVCHVESRKTKD
jgi:hypothetical protein